MTIEGSFATRQGLGQRVRTVGGIEAHQEWRMTYLL